VTVSGLVLFPGAGTSADHPSLVAIECASEVPVARRDFPYRRAGRRAPDRAPVLVEAVRTEVRNVAESHGVPTSRLVIGGRSMGGRMCSMAAADADDPLPVAGLVLIAYPLRPPRKPDAVPRTAHLPGISVPVLCVSGTRDEFGSPDDLREAFGAVPAPVEFVFLDGKRHDLARADDEVARIVRDWVNALSVSN
jgi:hypothetical protein